MKYLQYIFFFILIFIIFSSCQAIKSIPTLPDKTAEAIDYHMPTISEGLIRGAARGLNSPETEMDILEAVGKLIDGLNLELAKVDLGKLDVDVIGDELIVSLSESLESESLALGATLTDVLNNVQTEGLFDNISSEYNKQKLAELLGALFDAESGNGEKLGDMINTAIAGIDLSPLNEQIAVNLNPNEFLEPTLNVIESTGEEIGKIGSAIQRGQDKWISDLVSIWLAVMAGIFLARIMELNFFKRKARKSKEIIDETKEELNIQKMFNHFTKDELIALSILFKKTID